MHILLVKQKKKWSPNGTRVLPYPAERTHIHRQSLTHLWAGQLTTPRPHEGDTEKTEEDNKRRSPCVNKIHWGISAGSGDKCVSFTH